ncbi:MAG: PA2779 family protein [Gammaproteobacteria bacterium]|nr:PA2779 family protein [Gammaproteobacteria bacterium]
MKISKLLRKPAVFAVVVALSAAGIHAPVMAGTIDTPEIAMQAELQMQRDDVRSIMARADVRDTMLGYGVSASDIDTRINNLTESELLQIQNQLAQLPAGGSAVGIVLGIILIFVLLDVLGATDVFPRI